MEKIAQRGGCAGADFCHELSGNTDTEFHRTYSGHPISRIIGSTGSVVVMVDMSPLCTGHLLVVPTFHHLSFAETIRHNGREVRHALGQVLDLYAATFGAPMILEHGSSGTARDASCITHAHWHVLPLRLEEICRVMKRDGLSHRTLSDIDDLAESANGCNYFYCSDGRRHRLYRDTQSVPRQYLRSVAGALLGISDPEWDYALVIRKNLLRDTLSKTRSWNIHPLSIDLPET